MDIEITCANEISGVVVQALMSLFEFDDVNQTDLGGGMTLTVMGLVVVKMPYPDLTDCVISEIE